MQHKWNEEARRYNSEVYRNWADSMVRTFKDSDYFSMSLAAIRVAMLELPLVDNPQAIIEKAAKIIMHRRVMHGTKFNGIPLPPKGSCYVLGYVIDTDIEHLQGYTELTGQQ